MALTILSVAYPLTQVGPDAVGGSEQILTVLDRALTEAGHRSLVIAAEGSRVQGTLIASPKAGTILDDTAREWGRCVHRQLIRQTLDYNSIDLIHMHSLDFHCYMPSDEVPILATLHLPPDWYPRGIFQPSRRYFHLNCVSESQQRSCPVSSLLLRPVPNGVDVEGLAMRVPKGDFALAMGRICPEKAFHFALDAAAMARIPMMLAGEVFPYESHLHYFRKEIAPRLDLDRRFVGPLKLVLKKRMLSRAKCLVIPSTVAETSSLVAMEALSCGTPVVAFRNGALPEIIENGKTGFLVSDVKEMACALGEVDQLDSDACRESARARFSDRRMAADYIHLYGQLVAEKVNQDLYADASPCAGLVESKAAFGI